MADILCPERVGGLHCISNDRREMFKENQVTGVPLLDISKRFNAHVIMILKVKNINSINT